MFPFYLDTNSLFKIVNNWEELIPFIKLYLESWYKAEQIPNTTTFSLYNMKQDGTRITLEQHLKIGIYG